MAEVMVHSRSVRIGWIVMLILGAYSIICGLTMLASLEMTMHGPYEAYTGQSWGSFVEANVPKAIDYFNGAYRGLGFRQIAEGVLIIAIALYAFRRALKWSWYALLVAGLVIWVPMLFSGANPVITIIGLVLLVIGLAVPAKDILSQKSS